ncbi:MAG: hypothetical protein ABSG64_10395 [Solirubrobacteraceae bacterium]|jgi:hypothetical protein
MFTIGVAFDGLHGSSAIRFAVAIAVLSLLQAGLVALPAPRELPALRRLRSGWWALVPAGSVLAFIFAQRALSGTAEGLTYLSLIAVPLLAAVALGWLMRGARPAFALVAAALFALAWADRQGLAGESAGVLLDALSVVTLGVLLVAVTPARIVKVAIVVIALLDVWVVASNLLSAPNSALNGVAPVAHLPQLQRELLGTAVMGYEDLLIAGLLGALLATHLAAQRRAALLAALLALALNLLFFAVDTLPATVPIALTLLVLEGVAWRARARGAPGAATLRGP